MTTVQLTTLLPSETYILVYALPLLLVSLLLTVAGTFLTLDRTRSFPPKYTPNDSDKVLYSSAASFEQRTRQSRWWVLGGGVGGLATGFVFGIHFVTFISLLVPNLSTSSALSPSAFLAVCFISSLITCGVSGRYRYCAVFFISVLSGALTALAFSVILHPPISVRLALTAILSPLIALSTVLIYFLSSRQSPFKPESHYAVRVRKILHPLFRFCTASVGAFGVMLSISLIIRPPATSWANVWERLWIRDGDGWGTGQERGLSAGWCIFTCFGAACDWGLRWWLGDSPDEDWDDYLSNYVESLPHAADRAGSFRPLPSFWERIFDHKRNKDADFYDDGSPSKMKPLLTDDSSDRYTTIPTPAIPDPFYSHTPPPPSQLKLPKSKGFSPSTHNSPVLSSDDDYALPSFVKKRKRRNKLGFRLRNPDSKNSRSNIRNHITFGKAGNNSSESEDEKQERSSKGGTLSSLVSPDNTSSVTLVGSQGTDRTPTVELSTATRSDKQADVGPEYSDHEQDLAMIGNYLKNKDERGSPQPGSERQMPRFLEQHVPAKNQRNTPAPPAPANMPIPQIPPEPVRTTNGTPPLAAAPSHDNPLMASVPATPSLLNAIQRITVAQQDAYGPRAAASSTVSPNSAKQLLVFSPRWDEFWSEVREKARETPARGNS
ncbi:hypothetical protein AMATHDRAFT_66634 [Amanita thiersii Skay4041]|uniref:DUF4203 domain-containing protein n=1 Tax=Amanita thiersii Skay4041 TaxID=703135 RepID=A0A2A9NHT5_9AGAR|nr:hypothetical protein AMATHDRAFT_66634 [Amanita thiersii Skay4041]